MPLLKLQKASKSEKGKVGPKKGKGDGFVDDPLIKGDKSFKSRNMAKPTKSKVKESSTERGTKSMKDGR